MLEAVAAAEERIRGPRAEALQEQYGIAGVPGAAAQNRRGRGDEAARKKLKVTQVRSVIDRPKDQKDTVRRLGLHRIRDAVLKDERPEMRGMIAKVRHLVTIEEVDGT